MLKSGLDLEIFSDIYRIVLGYVYHQVYTVMVMLSDVAVSSIQHSPMLSAGVARLMHWVSQVKVRIPNLNNLEHALKQN